MNFKETLAKLLALSQWKGLENVHHKWKYDINLEICQFLEASREVDFSRIIGNYPELGQLMACLSQDVQVLTSPELFCIFVRNLLWFHRPTSTAALEMKASQWAIKLLRNMLAYPRENISKISASANLGYNQVSVEKLLEMLKKDLHNHLQLFHLASNCLFRSLAMDGLILLRNNPLDSIDLIDNILDILPPIHWKLCPEETVLFYQDLDRLLTKGSPNFPLILHKKLSRKFPVHLENELVKLLQQWITENKHLIEECLSSWLIDAASNDKELFHMTVRILNSIFVKLGKDSTIVEFIHQILQDIRTAYTINDNATESFPHLYPNNMKAFVYLLEVEAVDLSKQQVEQHSVFLMRNFTHAIVDRSIHQGEVAFLFSQFPAWLNCIHRLKNHQDPQVQSEYALFWNTITSKFYKF